ncbi:MAG: hypothetical protein IJZ53_05320 [Tyzzerella sp.]|nr:hypothetical protein [Tyzzerella sp.]
MSSKTKIVVLHMKEIIYTAVFVLLGILLIILLAFMFFPKQKNNTGADSGQRYVPGIYTSTVSLNNTNLEVEVVVDSSHINAIRFSNLDESVTTMYPLVQPTIEYIAEQIYDTQSLENIAYSEDSPYTSQVILNAIEDALEKGKAE